MIKCNKCKYLSEDYDSDNEMTPFPYCEKRKIRLMLHVEWDQDNNYVYIEQCDEVESLKE